MFSRANLTHCCSHETGVLQQIHLSPDVRWPKDTFSPEFKPFSQLRIGKSRTPICFLLLFIFICLWASHWELSWQKSLLRAQLSGTPTRMLYEPKLQKCGEHLGTSWRKLGCLFGSLSNFYSSLRTVNCVASGIQFSFRPVWYRKISYNYHFFHISCILMCKYVKFNKLLNINKRKHNKRHIHSVVVHFVSHKGLQ